MNTLSYSELSLIVGGSSQPVDFSGMTCTALQNHAGLFSSNWTDEDWANWAIAMENAGCYHGIITPSQPCPNPPGTN